MNRLMRLSPRMLVLLSVAVYIVGVPLLNRAGNGYFTILSLVPVITISLIYGTTRGLQSAVAFTVVNFGLVRLVEGSIESMTAVGGIMGSLSLFGVAWLVGYLYDLSSRRLRLIVEEKDRLIGTISHELRTPLTTVVGMSHELAFNLDSFTEDEVREFCALIAQQSGELEALIEDLLVAARADIERIKVLSIPVNLRHVVSVAIETTADESGRRPVVDAEEGVVARADELRVRQVVRNLLQNAYRYGGPGVRIDIRRRADQCVVTISDDGEGVPAGLVDTIFEPHVRAHATNGGTDSLGLGLYVSKTLAGLMGGTIEYRRTADRTHFDLVLPATE